MSRWHMAAALVLGAAAAVPASADVHMARGVTESWYAATVDHRDAALSVLILETGEGSHLVRTLDLAMLDIPVPEGERYRHAGETYVRAEDLTRRHLRLDPDSGRAFFIDPSGRARSDDPDAQLLLDIVLNGQGTSEPQLVNVRDGRLYLPDETREALRLLVPPGAEPGETGLGVHEVAGESYYWDPRRLRLVMTVPVKHLATTRIDLRQDPVASDVSREPSAILGYDLGLGRADEGGAWWHAGLDLAVAAGRVTCRSRHAWWSADGRGERIESACTADWPERAVSLRVGDAVSRAGPMSVPVRYAGVRVGTDYSLQPYLVTQPLMGVAGSARVPSKLEVWMDRQLVATRRLPPGPFRVDDIAPVTGEGELRAVVTDPFGRQTVISAPFYSDPSLLRPGLTDWALEAGVQREGKLTEDDRYTDAFAQAGFRTGLTDALTLEGRLQGGEFGAAAMLSGFTRLGGQGVLELGVSGSRGSGRSGAAGVVGYSYRGGAWNLGIRHFQAGDDYRALGLGPGTASPTRQTQLNAGFRVDRVSISLGYIGRTRDGDDENLATAAASLPLGDWGMLQLSAVRVLEPTSDLTLAAHLTVPFGERSQAFAGIGGDPSYTSAELGVQRNPPPGTGFGYRLQAGDGPHGSRYLLDGTWHAPAAELQARAYRIGGDASYQLSARGALLGTRSGVAAARGGPGGYAVVTTPAEGIGIYLDNQLRAHTDEDGRAVITGLRPFEVNRLSLDATQLPLDNAVRDSGLVLVPGRRAALVARFKVERVRQVFARLILEDGRPVPAGAALHSVNGEASAVVGYRGVVSLETRSAGNLTLRAAWGDRGCLAMLETGGRELGVLDLGRVTCREGGAR